MKYKALVLSFLLLLPLFAVFAITSTYGDFPQTNAQPVLWVDMNNTGTYGSPPLSTLKVWGPCVVSTNFPVDVKLWNDIGVTGNDVYAFDFNLTWNHNSSAPWFTAYPNDPHITLVGITTHVPTGWFIVDQTTLAQAYNLSYYHLAALAAPPATPFTTALNVSLVTLTFHIDDEPLFNPLTPLSDYFTTPFHLKDVAMSADGTQVIPLNPEHDDGLYWIGAREPDIHLTSADQFGPIKDTNPLTYPLNQGLYYINESAEGTVHTIKVMLSNITHAYGFNVYLTWNSAYKKTDIQKVKIGPDWILANYAYENIQVGTIGTVGYINITVIRPSVKPVICSKLSEAFEVDLTVKVPGQEAIIPFAVNTTISITHAWLLEKTKAFDETTLPYEYNLNYVGPTPLEPICYSFADSFYYSCDMVNMWVPKRADISLDGHVDVIDLGLLLPEYGQMGDWGNLASPGAGTQGKVDIFDFVYIAKKFGDC
jgi:hypothetical protein